MKHTLTVLLSGLLLCGCSQKPATSARPAIDLVEASKNVAWSDGYVVSIGKRDGTALEAVVVSKTGSDGKKRTFTADIATLLSGSEGSPTDENFVRIILHNAQDNLDGTKNVGEVTVTLHK